MRKPLAVLLAVLVLAGGAAGLYGWLRPGAPSRATTLEAPAALPGSTYEWIGGYLRWDRAHDEGRPPLYVEELGEGGSLRYIAQDLNDWANERFMEWEVSGVVRWRGCLFVQLWGEAVEPEDGSMELWVVLFGWVPETGRYELIWAELLDTMARYEARTAGGVE